MGIVPQEYLHMVQYIVACMYEYIIQIYHSYGIEDKNTSCIAWKELRDSLVQQRHSIPSNLPMIDLPIVII